MHPSHNVLGKTKGCGSARGLAIPTIHMKQASVADEREWCRQKGIGLIELMFAMALLVTVMTAAMLFLDQVMSRFQMARDHYVATTVCQGRIERARAIPYSDLYLMDEDRQLVDDFGNPAPNGRFRRTTKVRVDTPSEGLTTMHVRTDICICSRWGWRKLYHPLNRGAYVCRFEKDHEQMRFLLTDLGGR